jgi:hypothetical protein
VLFSKLKRSHIKLLSEAGCHVTGIRESAFQRDVHHRHVRGKQIVLDVLKPRKAQVFREGLSQLGGKEL